jgi:hypothetical protein
MAHRSFRPNHSNCTKNGKVVDSLSFEDHDNEDMLDEEWLPEYVEHSF